MTWSSLVKLVWNPKDRWDYDFIFVGMAVFFGVLLVRSQHLVLGIAFLVAVLALREVLYHYLVRRKRSSKNDAA